MNKHPLQSTLDVTWDEIKDHLVDGDHQSSYELIVEQLRIIDAAFSTADEAERAELLHLYLTWNLRRCQHQYYRTHCFTTIHYNNGGRSDLPAHIPELFKTALNAVDESLKIKAAIELAWSMLEQNYPHFPPGFSSQLPEVLKILQKCQHSEICHEGHIVSILINTIQDRLNNQPVNCALLTTHYNQLTLKSMAKHGIVPAKFAASQGFCLTSSDRGLSDSFSCIRFNFSTLTSEQDERENILKHQTHIAIDVMHKIALERSQKFTVNKLDKDALQILLQNRLHASIVFITDTPAAQAKIPFSFGLLQRETRLANPLPPDMIKAILVPLDQYETIRQIFPTICIIPVASSEIELQLSREVLKGLPPNTAKLQTLLVPDYETALLQYIIQFNPIEFMTHLSRLATEHDMQHFLLASPNREGKLSQQGTRKLIEQCYSPRRELLLETKPLQGERFFDRKPPEETQADSKPLRTSASAIL